MVLFSISMTYILLISIGRFIYVFSLIIWGPVVQQDFSSEELLACPKFISTIKKFIEQTHLFLSNVPQLPAGKRGGGQKGVM